MSYALTTTVRRPFADTLAATRASLTDQGFGVPVSYTHLTLPTNREV